MLLSEANWPTYENHNSCQEEQIMIFDSIHKTAILKLLNQLTTKSLVNVPSINSNGTSLDFKNEIRLFGIPVLSRIGLVIAKFERIFKPDILTDENNCISSEDGNRFYLQDILSLINYIEEHDLYGKEEPISHSRLETLQCSQHVHGLILCIREWIASFYCNKDFVVSLFPHTNEQHIFSLVEFCEENYCHMSILIFSILHKFGQSFSEYYLLLDFFFSCFSNLRSIPVHAHVDNNAFIDLLLKSIVHRRDERRNLIKQVMDKHKQIDHLQKQMQQQQQPHDNSSQQQRKQHHLQHVQDNLAMPKLIVGETILQSQSQQPQQIQQQQQQQQAHQQPQQQNSSTQQQINQSQVQPIVQATHIVVGKSINNDQNFHKILDMKTKKNKKNTAFTNFHIKPASDPDPICDQTHYCNICHKQFATAYKLQRHNYSHSGIRPFICNWENCDRSFNDNYHLKRHINSHTGNKPYSCHVVNCAKNYARMEDLRTHIKTHFPSGEFTNFDEHSHSLDGNGRKIEIIDFKMRNIDREQQNSRDSGQDSTQIVPAGIDVVLNNNDPANNSFSLPANIKLELQQIEIPRVIVENGNDRLNHNIGHHELSSTAGGGGNEVTFSGNEMTPVQIISEPIIPQTIILDSSTSNSNIDSNNRTTQSNQIHINSGYY